MDKKSPSIELFIILIGGLFLVFVAWSIVVVFGR